MEYTVLANFLLSIVLASHIASTVSQGLNPDFVKHLNEKVSHSLKQKHSHDDDPWNDNDGGDALGLINGLADAIKDFGKKRGKMVIDGRELAYETHHRFHNLDDGWVHDCQITDIASGVTLEVRHRKGEQQVIKEAVQKLFQELETKSLVSGHAEDNAEKEDRSSGMSVDHEIGSPPTDTVTLPGPDTNPDALPDPVRDREKPNVENDGKLHTFEPEQISTGFDSESIAEQDKDSLPQESETDEDTNSWSMLLKISIHNIASDPEILLSKIVVCILFVIAANYIFKRKSNGYLIQTSLARLLVDEIEPDGDGLYTHRMISAATPTMDQLDRVRNYDSMYRSQKKGLAYILNNHLFYKRSPGTLGRERKGSEVDLVNVQHIFTQIGYETIINENVTADKILHNIDTLVKRINREGAEVHSSLVLFLMSHGTPRGILGTDELEVSIDEIMARLSGKTCHALVEKPKIVFVQACRGRYFSVRDTVKGSWFVQATCEEFIAGAHIDDLDTMMESVTRRVTRLWGKMQLLSGKEVTMLQTPDIRKQGVRRKIYFAPKYPTSGSTSR